MSSKWAVIGVPACTACKTYIAGGFQMVKVSLPEALKSILQRKIGPSARIFGPFGTQQRIMGRAVSGNGRAA